jgi:CheY-like chemotaxis protein
MNFEKLVTVRNAIKRNPAYRASLAWVVALVATVAASTAVLAGRFFPGLVPGSGEISVVLLLAVVLPVILLAWLYSHRPIDTVDRYTEFAASIDGREIDEVVMDHGRPELRGLGSALNALSKRFYSQRQEWVRMRESLALLADLAEESPSVMLTIDHFGDIRYVNARAQQVISTLGLDESDYTILLPKPILELVESCITNQETLSSIEVSYNDHTFVWTVKPIAGKPMLLAHATVLSRGNLKKPRPETDRFSAEPVQSDPPQLYAISKHPAFRQKRTTVLVIDDDPLVHDLMSRFLAREGYEVHCASSGDAGLELAEQLKPDLITLDIMMPGKNGWIVLSALKDNPKLAAIPVIIISGVGNARFVHAMGADDYMSKPVDWQSLGKKVARLAPVDRASKVAQ